MPEGMDFQSPTTIFPSNTSRSHFFDFFQKSAFLTNFVRNCTSNILGTTGWSKLVDIKNWYYTHPKKLLLWTFKRGYMTENSEMVGNAPNIFLKGISNPLNTFLIIPDHKKDFWRFLAVLKKKCFFTYLMVKVIFWVQNDDDCFGVSFS